MEARTNARTRFSLPVSLYCTENDNYYHRKMSNISLGGLYVNGNPCGGVGRELSIIIDPSDRALELCERFDSTIVRRAADGFALKFKPLSERDERLIEQVVRPKWDGDDMYEGLLVLAAQAEEIADLAGYLRLTSLVSNQYRRLCRKQFPKA